MTRQLPRLFALVFSLLLAGTVVRPVISADEPAEEPLSAPGQQRQAGSSPTEQRIPAAEEREIPNIASRTLVNDRFLILNMHGLLFHERMADIQENIYYAQWMNAGAIRVFATDASRDLHWSGGEVANRIIDIAPMLRAANIKLIVALVNNHQEVPGEQPESAGYMDGYHQLLLPFYAANWQMAYRHFISDLIWLVKERDARDVIWAWEIGNEIHTQQDPPLVLSFIDKVVDVIRSIDDRTRILPGIMGSNHLEPWAMDSTVARDLFCKSPVSAYTLHTYDWRDELHGGDMPIHWDLRYTVRTQCEEGRALPVIVEELGTSRELPGVYSAREEGKRLEAELAQIRFVLSQPSVAAVGAWSAESPNTRRLRHDRRRGLTSYGENADGSGSCWGAAPGEPTGARCQLEQILRALPNAPQIPSTPSGPPPSSPPQWLDSGSVTGP